MLVQQGPQTAATSHASSPFHPPCLASPPKHTQLKETQTRRHTAQSVWHGSEAGAGGGRAGGNMYSTATTSTTTTTTSAPATHAPPTASHARHTSSTASGRAAAPARNRAHGADSPSSRTPPRPHTAAAPPTRPPPSRCRTCAPR